MFHYIVQPRTSSFPIGLVKTDDDDDELFLWYGWLMKSIELYFQLGPLSDILTILTIISAMLRAEFEPVQNMSSGLVELSCAVVITTTQQRHSWD